MGITIAWDNGRFCPKVICDVCNRAIDDASDANVGFVMSEDMELITLAYVHKKCDESGNERSWWTQLDEFLIRLKHNTGLTPEKEEKAKESMRFLDEVFS